MSLFDARGGFGGLGRVLGRWGQAARRRGGRLARRVYGVAAGDRRFGGWGGWCALCWCGGRRAGGRRDAPWGCGVDGVRAGGWRFCGWGAGWRTLLVRWP